MDIYRCGSRPSQPADSTHFTGQARVDPLYAGTEPARARAAAVTFEPGARTGWHRHPYGQALIVTAGCGRVQREGQPVQEIRQGDVVWILPGEKHWHGATDTTSMTHIAIAEHDNGRSADWFERVTDDQYAGRAT
jgi:quercetin dioxygenase-like cupin family protein